MTRPSPTTPKPSDSIPLMPRPTTTGAMPGAKSRTTTRPSPTTPKPSDSTPGSPSPTTTEAATVQQERIRQGHRRLHRGHPARPKNPGPTPTGVTPRRQEGLRQRQNAAAYSPRQRLGGQEGVRQGHRRLHRGHPTRAKVRRGLHQPGQRLELTRRTTTRPSPITPRPSDSTPRIRGLHQPGQRLVNKKDYDKAIADYNEAIRLDPRFHRLPQPGRCLDVKKDYDKAIADYTEAIRLDPKDAVAYNNRGDAWTTRRTTTRRSPTTTKPSGSIPGFLAYPTGETLAQKEGIRQGNRRFQRAIRLDPSFVLHLSPA